jgi:hypothetical protein
MHDRNLENRKISREAGICTLFEGDYHIGLAAFVNSLFHAEYVGPVWAGYRGALPPWLGQLQPTDDPRAYVVGGKIQLTLVPLETELHFTHYKSQFMLDLFAGPARDCGYLWYFDPDIFVRCKWSFFAEWQKHGVALCHDTTNHVLPADAPMRHQWMRVAESIGLRNPRPLNYYFNGGLVGVSAAHRSFLDTWQCIEERVEKSGYDRKAFRVGERDLPFMQVDQDALNVAAMYSEHPLTTMGPEAMGLIPAGFTMFHAIGPKPWRASFLRRAFAGIPPTASDKFFFTQVSSPIRVYSPVQLCRRRFACLVAAFVGRFYRRR